MPLPKTYAQAMARPSREVWPGCGDGRCMPCGRVHDFGWSPSHGPWVPRFQCSENFRNGCPQPHPEQQHEWNPSGMHCSRCGKKARWVAPDGSLHRNLKQAKSAGWKRRELKLESEVTD